MNVFVSSEGFFFYLPVTTEIKHMYENITIQKSKQPSSLIRRILINPFILILVWGCGITVFRQKDADDYSTNIFVL